MSKAYELVKNEPLTKSGEFFKIHGLYRYASHVYNDETVNCHVPDVAYCMAFQKGDKAPILPSYSHEIQ